MTLLRWRDIAEAPAKPGVYAWYYVPEITRHDLAEAVRTVDRLKADGRREAAADHLRAFLDDRLFSYFREQPYTALLRAPLKPTFEGKVEHRVPVSASLVERLVEEPRRLESVKEVLETSAPLFASPLYIGMSDRLKVRLNRHKTLIEGFAGQPFPAGAATEADERDHSFAREVRLRNIPPPRLFVVVQVVEGADGAFVDVENILNRIHYPLFGRN